MTADPARAVRAFVDAFNAEDLDAFERILAPHVEIQGRRGLALGRAEARAWATRRPSGQLHQRLVLDGVRVDGHPAVALLRRQWYWHENGAVADEEEFAALVSLDGAGLIAGWHPFESRSEALAAAGIGDT